MCVLNSGINHFFVTSIVFTLCRKSYKFSISTMSFWTFTHPTITSTTRHHSIIYIPNIFFLNWRNVVPWTVFVIKFAGILRVGQCWMVSLPLYTTSVTKKYLKFKCLLCFPKDFLPLFSSRIVMLLSGYKMCLKTPYPWASRKFESRVSSP